MMTQQHPYGSEDWALEVRRSLEKAASCAKSTAEFLSRFLEADK